MNNDQAKLKQAFGPLWEIYNNEYVHEIIVDKYDDVYYEESGKIINSENAFKNSDAILEMIKSLAKIAGKTVSSDTLSLNFTIDEFTRVNAVLPPLSVHGPSINLLKLPKRDVSWDDLIKWGAVDEKGKDLIADILTSNKSVLVAGNVGSGKTTLANLLIKTIPKDYRLVTLEKTAELSINRKRTARLEAVNHQAEDMVDLVKVASKMRADYLVLNELQGPEVMSFVELLRDGHSGIALISAENVFDSIKRLEFKALSSNFGGSIDDLRYSISQAFDYVIFQERRNDGKRVISRIGEIKLEDDELKLNIIYKK